MEDVGDPVDHSADCVDNAALTKQPPKTTPENTSKQQPLIEEKGKKGKRKAARVKPRWRQRLLLGWGWGCAACDPLPAESAELTAGGCSLIELPSRLNSTSNKPGTCHLSASFAASWTMVLVSLGGSTVHNLV